MRKLIMSAFGLILLTTFVFSKTNKEENLQVAVLAASGKAGSLIVSEAVSRGAKVSAFVRNAKKANFTSDVRVVQKDIFDLEVKDLEGFDIIIDAFGEWKDLHLHKKHIEHLAKILKGSKAKFLVVGGAGSLYIDESRSMRLYDTKDFPDEYRALSKAQGEALDFLRNVDDVNWVFVSPAAIFVYEGEKSGKYKIIGEIFEVNDKGESKVSYKDYASAMLDIALDPKYSKQRVGVIGL